MGAGLIDGWMALSVPFVSIPFCPKHFVQCHFVRYHFVLEPLERILWNKCSAKDPPFQSEGPTTENARFCLVVVREKGTIRKLRSVERRER